MTIHCTEALSELPLFVGGDLEPETQERIERHVERCASCREALTRAEAARGVLRDHFAAPGIELHTPDVWGGVRAGLLEAGLLRSAASAAPATPVLEPARPPRGRLLRWVPVAAAAAGLFFLGTRFGGGSGELPAPPAGGSAGPQPLVAVETLPGGVLPNAAGPNGGELLVPLEENASMLYEAQPWLEQGLPLIPHGPGGGASAVSYSPATRDGVR
ncbi:MAG: zf-HC2 domain-containing protein [Planctomycetes bacterium]|nr:zf-HC2 domain-containing protein [Planctomycetota bacterium]